MILAANISKWAKSAAGDGQPQAGEIWESRDGKSYKILRRDETGFVPGIQVQPTSGKGKFWLYLDGREALAGWGSHSDLIRKVSASCENLAEDVEDMTGDRSTSEPQNKIASRQISHLRINYAEAKASAERALQKRERAFLRLREAEIAEHGCKPVGFTINACDTCGRDESEFETCPHWNKQQEQG